MNYDNEKLAKELEIISEKILEFVNNLAKKENISYSEFAKLLTQENFVKIADKIGLTKIAEKNFRLFLKQSEKILEKIDKEKLYSAKYDLAKINNINKIRYELYLGKFELFVEELRLEFLKSYISADSFSELINNIKNRIPMSYEKIATAANTMLADFERDNIKLLFGNDKEIKFMYVGPKLETSSKQCLWLLDNQKEEGYSLSEIQKGIKTPYGEIDYYGRIPNFNCVHRWEPIL